MQQDRWAGEDEDDNIKDNWDDEDEVEEVSEEQVVIHQKKTMKQKIAEREERERLKKEEKLKEKELRNKKYTPEELLAQKLELQKIQEESDFKLAMDMFGEGRSKPKSTSSINLDEISLSTKEDFEKFKTDLVKKLSDVSSEPFYSTFLEDLFRDLCVPIDTDSLKKISSSLSALYNEKLKAQRGTNKTKKKTKGTSIKMEKNTNMIAKSNEYDEDYNDDLDDFM